MKKKILIVAAAALVTLGIATVSAQSPVQVQMSENFVFSVVEAPRYGAAGASSEYTVDANGNITLDVELLIPGDVSGDGEVSAKDKKIIYNHINDDSKKLDGYLLLVGDLSGDGEISAKDKKLLYNLIDSNS